MVNSLKISVNTELKAHNNQKVNNILFVEPYLIRNFYDYYDQKRIKLLYNAIIYNSTILNNLKNNTLNCDLKFENNILQLNANIEKVGYQNFLVIVGKYFENYHYDSNTFWTNSKEKIRDFFINGLILFKKIKCKLDLEIFDNDVPNLVNILNGEEVDEELFNRLCNRIKLLKNNGWLTYKDKIIEEYNAEIEAKRIEEVTSMDLPDDWMNLFENEECAKGVFASSVSDGLILSLNNLGEVNIEYIAQITGLDCKEVIESLKGSIYQNPEKWEECFYKGWETADCYLSGRIVDKWRIAKEANKKYNGYFKNNVDALSKIKPDTINEAEIYVTLGSP